MIEKLEQYLLGAAGNNQQDIAGNNPFRTIGFDQNAPRLGWVRPIPFLDIKKSLDDIDNILKGKDTFIFVGIGGSGNGIKALLSLFKESPLYTLDSLDPAALEELISKIAKKTDTALVIPISKSGTTKETQLLSHTLKEVFGKDWKNHFLWLSDPNSFEKLSSAGWQEAKKCAIQPDANADMGGRFSCPGSLIFLLPLFLLLKKNFNELERIYNEYCFFQETIRHEALEEAIKYKDTDKAYFNVYIDPEIHRYFYPWVVQLFQESIGSKKESFFVKTASLDVKIDGFYPLKLKLQIKNPVVSLMCQMYFLQNFVAFYAALKGLNFVNQDYVEKYKSQMRKLEGEEIGEIPQLTLDEIISEVKKKIGKQPFVEVVLYFHPFATQMEQIKSRFNKEFSAKQIFVFVGSDWNHHSYQAAFADKNSFFVILLAASFNQEIKPFSSQTLNKNIESLKLIAKATHLTIVDKSLLASLS
ncbi:MAG: hypothetical protein JSW17_01055 [Candidatus Omnitrophota bacterium]|nr:MAG: hypothetical protein JSW17_01055 [Candidatus Omnitrophota bacterium]